MREIVLDTETTGLDPLKGDRIIEIGCIELLNHMPTGDHRHFFINPERDVPLEAQRIHGISDEMLVGKPLFSEIVDEFLDFIGDSQLIIHNASFDMRFLNMEFERCGYPTLPITRAIDTLMMARTKFPGAQANLDALCRRFNIDSSKRDKHGALIDSELLASVYLELIGGREPGLVLRMEPQETIEAVIEVKVDRSFREPRYHAPTPEEIAAHEDFLKTLKSKAGLIWFKN